jgi:segregation and condensation protein B
MTDLNEMLAALEAVLFVSPEPVSRRRLLDLFLEEEQEEAAAAVQELERRFSSDRDGGGAGRGIILEEVAGGLRLITRPDLDDWLRTFFDAGRSRKLSIGALETLAIVAYRQPVTAPEIQELRSVNPSGVLKTLLERRMVRIAGRKEVVGKPFLYATTQDFLVHFGLRSLKDLPPLEEFEEALAGEGLGELLGGTDFEEVALREAASIEDADEDKEDRAAEAGEAEEEEGPRPVEAREAEPQELEPQGEEAQDEEAQDEEPQDEEAQDEESEDEESEDVESQDLDPEDVDLEDEDLDEPEAAEVEVGRHG